jgi:hypothetical protein
MEQKKNLHNVVYRWKRSVILENGWKSSTNGSANDFKPKPETPVNMD